MKVIISGAGIAGLTLATRLGAAGWDVHIVDSSSPESRDCLIDFHGLGYAAAERMNLVGALRGASYEVPEIIWRDSTGKISARLRYKATVRRVSRERSLTLMRGDIERVLYGSLPRSVRVDRDCEVEEVRLPGNGLSVQLSTGESEHADLLIGADGSHSRVRQLMLGDSESAFRFLGFHTAAFVFDDRSFAESLEGKLQVLCVPNRQVAFFPLRGGKVAAFFAHRMTSTAIPSDPRAELERLYQPLGWKIPAALAHARQVPHIHYDYAGQVQLRRWSFGRVVLVGDACQCPSPLAGQGASLAMHGAYVLADELVRARSLDEALARYELAVKPQAERKQSMGRRIAPWLVPSTDWRLSMRHLLIRLADARSTGWMLRPMLAQA